MVDCQANPMRIFAEFGRPLWLPIITCSNLLRRPSWSKDDSLPLKILSLSLIG